MIEIKELKKQGNDGILLDGISVKLNNGAAYGILDTSQASAHAFVSLLAGVILPDSGVVRVNGLDTAKEGARARACVGFLPKHFIPYLDMTPDEYLVFVSEAKNLDYEVAMHSIHELIGTVELRGRRSTLCKHLTPAEQKRLGLAQALLGSPEFIIADDPHAGLGDRDARDMLDRIAALSEGKTLFLSSASLADLRYVCEVILVLDNGKLQGIYDADDRALDALYGTMCEQCGSEADPVAIRGLSRRHKSARQKRDAISRDGKYELIDDEK